MSEVFYNSRSELDKLPFGAVAAGTELRFGIRLHKCAQVSAVRLVIKRDEDGKRSVFPLSLLWQEGGFARFECSAVLEASGLYWYFFEVDANGGTLCVERSDDNTARFASSEPCCWQLTVYENDYTTPEWIMGGAFYHIFVDRFAKSGELPLHEGAIRRSDWGGTPEYRPDEHGEILNNDFFGGNLNGICEKLPYLAELGISCIYLSPIFEAASNHKYDTGDYSRVDCSFGDDAALKRLCDSARELGIRVILDGVFNHTGADSKYFNRFGHYDSLGAYQSESSPYFTWYCFSGYPDDYAAWWGIKTLPQLNEEEESLRSYLFGEDGIMRKWMGLGVSGWRLDVADELSDETLDTIRKTVKGADPQALIIGEVWEDASNKVAYGQRRRYLQGRQLDSVMNYPYKNAIIDYVKGGDASALRETIESICENYPSQSLNCMMNGLGTHDTARILTVLGGRDYATRDERAAAVLEGEELKNGKELLRLAGVLQFTLPGVPCVYYGDEAGVQGYEDPFNRRCYPWGKEDRELIEWYKRLFAARRSCAAFAGGDYKTLRAEGGVFIFSRFKDGISAITAVNLSNETLTIDISTSTRILITWNAVSGDKLAIHPRGCAVLERKEK